jgi:predicted MFS family arabinose efflux permease
MNFLRNTFAVLVGLAVAGILISLGVRLNSSWITYQEYAPFKHWKSLLQSMEHKPYFFVALLISSGIGATVGGVVTAILVKYAKVAYAILIGFILLFIAMLDIIIYPYHPTFYKILIFLTFFPCAWMGGKITEIIYKRKKRNKLRLLNKQKRNL